MSTRVAINGFGRIGRAVLRSAIERNAELEVVAVHDVAARRRARAPARARFDLRALRPSGASGGRSARRRRPADPGRRERGPSRPSWGELGADVVIEATGRLRTRTDAARHIDAGARKVIVSAPIKGPEPADADLVLGVNFDEVYDPERHHIVSNVSCTTNCLAPLAKVLHETVGIRHGLMTTIHAYTADQQLLDAPHKDLRRARAAAVNLVPTSTGAAKALGLVIPELEGRLTASPSACRSPPARSSTSRWRSSGHDNSRGQRRIRGAGNERCPCRHSRLQRRADRVLRHRQVALLRDPRRAAYDGHRRHPGEGRRVVRQRVGLREPARGTGRAGAHARARDGLSVMSQRSQP